MTAAEEPLVTRQDEDGVRILTLNRPAARNALSLAMMTALRGELVAVKNSPEIKAVVLAAAGPVFCAGHDLKELRSRNDPAWLADIFTTCSAMMMEIVRLPQPVIARVHGTATAAGCQLVATADLAIAASSATFATPGVNIGLFCSTPMVALSRNVPRKQAMEMLLTGAPITAARAAEIGLINRAVPADRLDAAIAEMTDAIRKKAPKVLAIGKRAFYAQAEISLEDAYAHTSAVMARNMIEPEAREGIDAFIEKRPPVWPGGV